MKKMTLSVVLLLLMATACKKAEDKAIETNAKPADSITVKDETPVAPMDSTAVKKAWADYKTPGEIHKVLALDNGTWAEDLTFWDYDGATPTKNTATAVSKMIMGGRYQEMRHSATMMGEPFEAINYVTFDNASGKVVSSWMDNMSTSISTMTGNYDASSKKFDMKGETTDPVTKKVKPTHETYTLVDDNTRKVEIFDTNKDGKEYKSMEIVMKRK